MEHPELEKWVNINSESHNLKGLKEMADVLQVRLEKLKGRLDRITLPPVTQLDGRIFQAGDVIRFRFNEQAPLQVLFSGHMDTVHSPESPFRTMSLLPDGRYAGPGVTDMKGGLYILIEAVGRFMEDGGAEADLVGGTILINADEEVGSPASRELLLKEARKHDLGLVFESALPGGELVSQRKGTGNFRISVKGKAAHSGRDFEKGRNSIVVASDIVLQCHGLNGSHPETIVNVGFVEGGGALNIVPDKACAWLNIRVGTRETADSIKETLEQIRKEAEHRHEGVQVRLEGDFFRPPKQESKADARLHQIWNECESALGYATSGKRATGGSSDGNLFSSVGLPHLDGVGIRGGAIHSPEEFAIPESISGQIERTLAFLKRAAREPRLHQRNKAERKS